ncbi:hypothetical protein SAY86_002097 [Trapa natans]|uniref:RING-type domain-containing protein n=1 Tax=Trapa natans TaxID=22666 RepID=A0AAN7LP83_TRANT|nr:hypothetical protein SAY86_002097 [Trapa natans]
MAAALSPDPEDHSTNKQAYCPAFCTLPFDLDEVLSPAFHHPSSHFLDGGSPRSSPDWRSIVMAFPAGTGARCSVCMEGFRVDSGRRIPCGHVYHADCITTWLSLGDSCPLCRLKVSPETKETVRINEL